MKRRVAVRDPSRSRTASAGSWARLAVLILLSLPGTPCNVGAQTIYMVALGISRMDVDGSDSQLLFGQLPNSFFEDIAVNTTTGVVYFIEASTVGGGTVIHRYNPGGSSSIIVGELGFRTIISVTVDETAEKVYYSATRPDGRIRRCGPSGESVETFVSGLGTVLSMDVDSSGGTIYWSEYDGTSQTGSISRAGLPFGQNRVVILSGLGMPTDIVVDDTGGRLYWVDGARATIQRANLDGTAVEILVNAGANTPNSIIMDRQNSKILWIDSNTGDVERSNLDGTGRETAFNFFAARRFDIDPGGRVGVEHKSWGTLKRLYR